MNIELIINVIWLALTGASIGNVNNFANDYYFGDDNSPRTRPDFDNYGSDESGPVLKKINNVGHKIKQKDKSKDETSLLHFIKQLKNKLQKESEGKKLNKLHIDVSGSSSDTDNDFKNLKRKLNKQFQGPINLLRPHETYDDTDNHHKKGLRMLTKSLPKTNDESTIYIIKMRRGRVFPLSKRQIQLKKMKEVERQKLINKRKEEMKKQKMSYYNFNSHDSTEHEVAIMKLKAGPELINFDSVPKIKPNENSKVETSPLGIIKKLKGILHKKNGPTKLNEPHVDDSGSSSDTTDESEELKRTLSKQFQVALNLLRPETYDDTENQKKGLRMLTNSFRRSHDGTTIYILRAGVFPLSKRQIQLQKLREAERKRLINAKKEEMRKKKLSPHHYFSIDSTEQEVAGVKLHLDGELTYELCPIAIS